MFSTITAEELKKKLDGGAKIRLIDVREPHEFDYCRIEGSESMPLGRISEWGPTLSQDDELVLLCHHGMRSQRACMLLAGNGFTHVTNLTGGIDQWSLTVDPEVRRY